jgi:hypothetical protein
MISNEPAPAEEWHTERTPDSADRYISVQSLVVDEPAPELTPSTCGS